MQEFGSGWTVVKLEAVENYLASYTTALKNSNFKLCYIDAFAGSGSIKIKGGDEIEGSAIRALKYPFNKFHFFEADQEVIETLKQKIKLMPNRRDVEFRNSDCNSFLLEIDKIDWAKENWRGVILAIGGNILRPIRKKYRDWLLNEQGNECAVCGEGDKPGEDWNLDHQPPLAQSGCRFIDYEKIKITE